MVVVVGWGKRGDAVLLLLLVVGMGGEVVEGMGCGRAGRVGVAEGGMLLLTLLMELLLLLLVEGKVVALLAEEGEGFVRG